MKIVLCNCPVEQAEKVAEVLLQEKISACVNIIPKVQSLFFWEGKVCREEEATLLIKIRKHDFSALEQRINEIHPYSVPEIVELNVSNANAPYVEWLYQSTDRGS